MLSQLSILFAVFAAVYANGEFVVLHLPDSIEFTINERGRIEQSYLKEILSACLGYTGKQKDLEHSIVCNIRNPFSVPKALIAIVVEGTEHLPSLKDKAKVTCPLIYDEVEESTWQAIRSRVDERSNDNTLVRINLSDGVDALGQSALGELKPLKIEKLTALNSDIEEDRKFVEEVELLYAIGDIASSAKKHDSDTDVYWLVVSTLKPCLEMHGNNSAAKKEAHQLLSDAIEHVSKGFLNIYNGKIIIAIFTNDGLKVRNARSVLERKRRDDPPPEFSGRAKTYTEDYPVIFNIMLWFGVVFVFSLLAICIAIANMDPGRDSIIYRMTSNRMKKDN